MTRRHKMMAVILCIGCFIAGGLYTYAASLTLPAAVERLNAEARWRESVYLGLLHTVNATHFYLRTPSEADFNEIKENLAVPVEVMEFCGTYQGYVAKHDKPISAEALTAVTEYLRETYDFLCEVPPDGIASEAVMDCIRKLDWILEPPIAGIELSISAAKLLPQENSVRPN